MSARPSMRDRGRRSRQLGVLLAALSIVLDGFDGQLIGYATPVIIQEWGVSREDFVPVVPAGLIGMGFGSALAGYVCDRFGRRPAIIGSVLLFGVADELHRLFRESRDHCAASLPRRTRHRRRSAELHHAFGGAHSGSPAHAGDHGNALSACRWAACLLGSTQDTSCRSWAGACCSGWAARCLRRSASC